MEEPSRRERKRSERGDEETKRGMKERKVKLWNGRRRGQGGHGRGGREGGTNLVLIGFDVRLHGKH